MSDPTETHGTECVYCGQDHPKRGGCPLPDMPIRTDAQLRRDAGLLAAANALADDPNQMAAFIAGLGLLARAGVSPASGCEESAVTAGGHGAAVAPGLAGMVGSA